MRRNSESKAQAGIRLVVARSVVVLHQPVARAGCDELLVQAIVTATKTLLAIAAQIFKMEPYCPRMIEVGCKVVRGLDVPVTAVENGLSNVGWQPVNMIGIPGPVVRTGASERRGRALQAGGLHQEGDRRQRK